DFFRVLQDRPLTSAVPIVLTGHAPATEKGGILSHLLTEVEVECLPGDIPNHLVADLTKLKNADDELLVRDLVVPTGVKVLTAPDHVVFSLTLSRAGAIEEAPAEAPSAEVEVVAKGKAAKEGAEEVPEKPEKK
ncbi:MAG: 50S ribosomal protein L25, partial [Anaerolineae bacterium]